METRKISVQQGTTGAPVQQPAEDFRLNAAGMWTPDPGGNRNIRSGTLPGPLAADGNPPLSVIATPSVAASLTIKAGHFVIQSATALAGAYVGTVDADKTRAITSLPTSGGYKAGRVVIHVYDQVYGDAQDGWDIEVMLGTQASSAGAAALPVVPATSTYLELAEFTVDAAGNVSFIGNPHPLTVPRGGILPVSAAETANGSYVGQYRDHPTLGLQRWTGVATGWAVVHPLVYLGAPYSGNAVTGAFTTLVTVPVADPGWPYRVLVDAVQSVFVSPGSTWNFTARIDAVGGELIRPVGVATSTSSVPVPIVGGATAGSYTGPHSVIFNAEKISGQPGDGYQPAATPNLQSYRVQVLPA